MGMERTIRRTLHQWWRMPSTFYHKCNLHWSNISQFNCSCVHRVLWICGNACYKLFEFMCFLYHILPRVPSHEFMR